MAARGDRFNIIIGDHTPIADEDQAAEPESLVQIGDGLADGGVIHLGRLRGDRPGKRFSRSATDGSRTALMVQHRSVTRGDACMPFDEQRQVGPPAGRSSATNTYDRNGRT